LLDSEWNTEGSRPRRYYVRNGEGSQLLELLKSEWRDLVDVLRDLLD
jgi:DNA-binding PadR family transcriptional regulator